jgi:hypothetical protein
MGSSGGKNPLRLEAKGAALKTKESRRCLHSSPIHLPLPGQVGLHKVMFYFEAASDVCAAHENPPF